MRTLTRSMVLEKAAGLPVLVAALALWEIASRTRVVDPIFLPAPSSIVLCLYQLLGTTSLWASVGTTVYRFLVGYFLGCAIAIPLGILMGISRRVYLALEPLVEMLRPIPVSALIPVALLLLGLGDSMVFAIVAVAVIWPVLINTVDGVRGVDPMLIDTGRVFGLDRKGLVRKVILPACLPSVFTGMRISLATSLVLVIVIEMIIAGHGLGTRLIDAERTFRFREMYGIIVLVGVLGYSVNRVFLAGSRSLIGWHIRSKGGST